MELNEAETKLLEEIDAALRDEVQENGPMLIWLGEGEFPRTECNFRGLSIGEGRSRLTQWVIGRREHRKVREA